MQLILHVGTFKTGTTAIQNYFFENRDALRELGLIYPKSALHTKDVYGPRHKRLTFGGHQKVKPWRNLLQELQSSDAEIAVISCEGFWKYPKRAEEIMERLAPYNPSVIVGLRRQDRFVASWHLQRIKHEQDLTPPEEIVAKCDEWLHYYSAAETWSEAFGEGSVRPFLYDEVSKDSVRSFFEASKLSSKYLLGSTNTYKDSNRTPNNWTPESVMGENLTREIIARYADDNAKLFAKYFPDVRDWPEPLPQKSSSTDTSL